MDTLEKLVELFKKFPGIGPRQARRFAYHILNEPTDQANELGELIKKLKSGILSCDLCFRFFAPKSDLQKLCNQCSDLNRDPNILMLLTQDTDISAIEQRKIYNGLYFVVGKNAELTTMHPSDIPRLQDLKKQFEKFESGAQTTKGAEFKHDIQINQPSPNPATTSNLTEKTARKDIKEIILAMNANTEGEHTAEIIRTFLKSEILPLNGHSNIRITTLGRGLSTGTELEYSDAETLKSALDNRRLM